MIRTVYINTPVSMRLRANKEIVQKETHKAAKIADIQIYLQHPRDIGEKDYDNTKAINNSVKGANVAR